MLDIISDKILEQNKRISILTKKSTREKLLEYFHEESNKQFSRNLYLPFNLTELAEYLSVDRSAMMREIKRLREDKIIESSGKHIRLLI
jgi:CRP-like cAMP-binding protein